LRNDRTSRLMNEAGWPSPDPGHSSHGGRAFAGASILHHGHMPHGVIQTRTSAADPSTSASSARTAPKPASTGYCATSSCPCGPGRVRTSFWRADRPRSRIGAAGRTTCLWSSPVTGRPDPASWLPAPRAPADRPAARPAAMPRSLNPLGRGSGPSPARTKKYPNAGAVRAGARGIHGHGSWSGPRWSGVRGRGRALRRRSDGAGSDTFGPG